MMPIATKQTEERHIHTKKELINEKKMTNYILQATTLYNTKHSRASSLIRLMTVANALYVSSVFRHPCNTISF